MFGLVFYFTKEGHCSQFQTDECIFQCFGFWKLQKKPSKYRKKLYVYGQKILPKWLQCQKKNLKDFCQKNNLQPSDLLIGILQSIDGENNHAISIFNDLIFDSNKILAMFLRQGNLNYSCSTTYEKFGFVKF